MNNKNIKIIKNQISRVVKDVFPELYTKEFNDKVMQQLAPMVDSALTSIKDTLLGANERHREQSKASENKLLTEASKHLQKMNISMMAFQTILAEKLAMANLIGATFNTELEEKKKEIAAQIDKELTEASNKT